MEVLVLAARESADLHLDAVLHALQASPRSINIVGRLPRESQHLDDHQLLLTRKRMTNEALAAWIEPEDRPPALQPPDRPPSSASTLPVPSSAATAPPISQDPSQYIKKIVKKNKKIRSLTDQVAALKQSLAEAAQRVKHMELEQEQFFEDVQEMKTQFGRLSDAHRKVLWEYLPAHDADMSAIPLISTQIEETPTCVGGYPLEQVLGYGQYAIVYSSSLPGDSPPLAVKAIDKNKVMDLVSLHRINSEIASLSDPAIQHPCILSLKDVIHTKTHVYLVTERGGKDLFEYFGAHQVGLDEDVIKPLMLQVAQAVHVLHHHNYCHRDLKPENILYSPDSLSLGSRAGLGHADNSKAPHLVKLIDFGLCTKAVTPEYDSLRDFCGSPGFFAPEMLLADSYDGFKADVWSVGCILLELVLGNTAFSAEWMTVYDLPVLKDHERFAQFIRTALSNTREFCNSAKWTYSGELRQLLLSVLAERPSERFSIQQMLEHPWFTSDSALMATYGSSRHIARAPSSPAPGTLHPSPVHPHHQHLQHQQTAPVHSHTNDSLLMEQPSVAAFAQGDSSSSSPLGRRASPSKIKSLSTSSAPSTNALRLGLDSPSCVSTGSLEPGSASLHSSTPPACHPSGVRPLSPAISSSSSLALAKALAEENEPRAALASPASSSPGKVSLPSLSPEKPSGQRSPDKTFAKRPAHPSSPERPTSPKL